MSTVARHAEPRAATLAIGELPTRVDLLMYQGDDVFITVTVNDGVTPIDLTTYEPRSEIRPTPGSNVVLATFDGTVLDAHTILLHLTTDESTKVPASAAWDVQITDSAGIVATLAYGLVTAMRQVTT